MTIGERALNFASKAKGEDLRELIESALEEELSDLAHKCDAEAARKKKLYRDLGLDAETEARAFEGIAVFIRSRIADNQVPK